MANLSTFSFEEYYDTLNKLSSIDAFNIKPNTPESFISDNIRLFIAPTLRAYIAIFKEKLYEKYKLPEDFPTTNLTNQFLSLDEEKKILGIEEFNNWKQYWNAYQDYRKKTPQLPPRGTVGTEELIDALVFGRRNANLFGAYQVSTPEISKTAIQINKEIKDTQQKNLTQSKITSIKSSISKI